MAPSKTADATSALFRPIAMFLSAHDEGDPEPQVDPTAEAEPASEPAKPSDPAPAEKPEPEPTLDPPLGDAGQKAIAVEREKRKAAAAEAQKAKADLVDAQRKLQEFEDAKKSDLEKAQADAARAQAREVAANRRAVTSDIRSAAIAAEALDPSDLVDALAGRQDEFIVDGVIDEAGIEAAVADLLVRKKHWKRAAVAPVADPTPPPVAPKPKPDPGQGPRGAAKPVDFLKATAEEVAAELNDMGIRSY